MNVTLEVKQVVVIESKSQTDRICITLNSPTPYPNWTDETIPASLILETAQHYGKVYCESILGIPVDEVITVR